jgi:membrane-associated protease RseP (regulator of RpoE activity)
LSTGTFVLAMFAFSVFWIFPCIGICVFLHELGHACTSIFLGCKVKKFRIGTGTKWARGFTLRVNGERVKVYFSPDFASGSVSPEKPASPSVAAAIILAGPVVNLLLAGIGASILWLTLEDPIVVRKICRSFGDGYACHPLIESNIRAALIIIVTGIFALVNAAVVMIALIPTEGSDGHLLLKIARGKFHELAVWK